MQISSESDICTVQPSDPPTLQTRIVLRHRVKNQVKNWARIVLFTGFFLVVLGFFTLPMTAFKVVDRRGCMAGHCGKVGLGTSLIAILTGAIGMYAGWKQEIRLARCYSRAVLALVIMCCFISVCLPTLLSRPEQSGSKPAHHPVPNQTPLHPRPGRPSSPQIDRLRDISRHKKHSSCQIPKPAHTAFYLFFFFSTIGLILISTRFRKSLASLASTQTAEIEEIRLVV